MSPAKSKSQHAFMAAICHRKRTPPKGLTKKQACEFIKGQDPKDLPDKKPEIDDNI